MEQTITIKKNNAIKALKGAKGELRQRLVDLLGGNLNQNPMDFKTYEEVCEADGIDLIGSLPFANPTTKKQVSSNGLFKLETIFEAFNSRCGENFDEEFVPDYNNGSQRKYYPIHDWVPSLGAFVYTSAYYTFTRTFLGARLCTDTDAKAAYIAKQFPNEWNEFLNPQI